MRSWATSTIITRAYPPAFSSPPRRKNKCQVSFLGVLVTHEGDHLSTTMYCKPTHTNLNIPYTCTVPLITIQWSWQGWWNAWETEPTALATMKRIDSINKTPWRSFQMDSQVSSLRRLCHARLYSTFSARQGQESRGTTAEGDDTCRWVLQWGQRARDTIPLTSHWHQWRILSSACLKLMFSHYLYFRPDDDWSIQSKHQQGCPS